MSIEKKIMAMRKIHEPQNDHLHTWFWSNPNFLEILVFEEVFKTTTLIFFLFLKMSKKKGKKKMKQLEFAILYSNDIEYHQWVTDIEKTSQPWHDLLLEMRYAIDIDLMSINFEHCKTSAKLAAQYKVYKRAKDSSCSWRRTWRW